MKEENLRRAFIPMSEKARKGIQAELDRRLKLLGPEGVREAAQKAAERADAAVGRLAQSRKQAEVINQPWLHRPTTI